MCLQSQAVVAEGCGQQLQRLSLLEEERQRVAQLRRMQLESEQFRHFEDQLRRQELANRREEAASQLPEQTDGSCLTTQAAKNHVRALPDPDRNKPPPPSAKAAGTVQSEWLGSSRGRGGWSGGHRMLARVGRPESGSCVT